MLVLVAGLELVARMAAGARVEIAIQNVAAGQTHPARVSRSTESIRGSVHDGGERIREEHMEQN